MLLQARPAPRQQNPIPSTEANLLDGARLYRDKCADCHGRPDNPMTDYGGSFYPRVPQFMKARPRLSESQNFYVIKYGVRWTAMPAWGNIMADSEVWQVVTFLSHLETMPPSSRAGAPSSRREHSVSSEHKGRKRTRNRICHADLRFLALIAAKRWAGAIFRLATNGKVWVFL